LSLRDALLHVPSARQLCDQLERAIGDSPGMQSAEGKAMNSATKDYSTAKGAVLVVSMKPSSEREPEKMELTYYTNKELQGTLTYDGLTYYEGYVWGWNDGKRDRLGHMRVRFGEPGQMYFNFKPKESGDWQAEEEAVHGDEFVAKSLKRAKSCVLEDCQEPTPDTLSEFAEALLRKALDSNLQPYLGLCVKEFRAVVPDRILDNLTPNVLRGVICGQRLSVEEWVAAWQAVTYYQGAGKDDPHVRWFWDYAKSLDYAHFKHLFFWATGFAVPPTTPWRFMIRTLDSKSKDSHPTVTTCTMLEDVTMTINTQVPQMDRGIGKMPDQSTRMPTLKIPDYSSAAILELKFTRALEEKGMHLA